MIWWIFVTFILELIYGLFIILLGTMYHNLQFVLDGNNMLFIVQQKYPNC